MYTPSHFEESRLEVLQQLIEAHSLGAMVSIQDGELTADHLPFRLVRGQGSFGILQCHVARSNPVWREASGSRALVIFQGPQVYVSPNAYPTKMETGKAVPTWNYAVVHAHGSIRIIDDAEWLRSFVDELTQRHEERQEAPWSIDDAPKEYLDRMLQGIVGIEIEIERLEGKWKMSQNQPQENIQGVIELLQKNLRESL